MKTFLMGILNQMKPEPVLNSRVAITPFEVKIKVKFISKYDHSAIHLIEPITSYKFEGMNMLKPVRAVVITILATCGCQ